MPHRVLVRKVGLRGEAMIFLGFLWFLVGLGTSISPIEEFDEALWHTFVPPYLRMFLWAVSGLWAWYSVKTHKTNCGLGILIVMPILQTFSFLWGWILYCLPGDTGYPDGWYYAVLFSLMLAAVVFVAHVPASTVEKKKIEKEELRGK